MVLTNSQKFKAYNEISINTSTQEALILKCYNGILACLRFSRENMDNKDQWPSVDNEMIKAQKGVGLLAGAVKTENEVGENLLKLYDFIIRFLVKANLQKDKGMVDEVIVMIDDMKQAWEKAFDKLHAESNGSSISQNRKPQGSALNIVG